MYSRVAQVAALCLGLVLCASVALAGEPFRGTQIVFQGLNQGYLSSSPNFRSPFSQQRVTQSLEKLKGKFETAVQSHGCVPSAWQEVASAQDSLELVLGQEQANDKARVQSAPISEQPKLRELARQQKSADDQLASQLKGVTSRAKDSLCP